MIIATKTLGHQAIRQLGIRPWCRGWLVLSLLILSACSSTAVHPNLRSIDWQQHSENVSQIHTWTLRGKLGIRSPNDATSANLLWQQSANEYHIRLSGPFGQGAVHIYGDANGVTLERAGKPTIQAKDADQLLAQQLGWQFPIKQVYYWVRGLPAPNLPINKLALANNALQHLEQGGWQLDYSRYQIVQPAVSTAATSTHTNTDANTNAENLETSNQAPEQTGVSLPGKIVLLNNKLKITFILKQWQLANASQ